MTWQRVAHSIIARPQLAGLHSHLRRKLDLFNVNVLPGRRVARALWVMQNLARLTPPRVSVAYLRTITNGWMTAGRFQAQQPCRFGCRHGKDTLLHCLKCPVAGRWRYKHARLRSPPGSLLLEHSLIMGADTLDGRWLAEAAATNDAVLSARGRHLYALYRTHNALRYRSICVKDAQNAYKGFLMDCRSADP